MRRNRKLSASGCSSCGSNFTGDSKPCSCGRNPGGSCQCNNGGSSARMGHGVSQPIQMPILNATGRGKMGDEGCPPNMCMNEQRECIPCSSRKKPCPKGQRMGTNGCESTKPNLRLRAGQRVAFPNNSSAKKYDMLKFSNFVSKVKSNGRKNFVNPTNFGAAEDETFAYNPRVVKDFSTNTKGFLDKSDLNNYSF